MTGKFCKYFGRRVEIREDIMTANFGKWTNLNVKGSGNYDCKILANGLKWEGKL